jgi:hypothetical protein
LKPRQFPELAWIFFCCFAAACLFFIIDQFLRFSHLAYGQLQAPYLPPKQWRNLLFWPLQAIAVWGAIGITQLVFRQNKKYFRYVLGFSIACSFACFLLFSQKIVYDISLSSLKGGKTFPLPVAIDLLGYRGKDSDIEEIWNFVQKADWEAAGELQKNTCVGVDWRERAVDALEKNQGDFAAERFSEMLRKRPNASMADACAEILMRHKRYETAPLIFRYALWDNKSCKTALEKELKLPQIGSLILIKDMDEQSSRINDTSTSSTKFMPV